jgi:transposase
MPRFVGLDAHKRSVEVCILGESGEVVARHRLGGDRKSLEAFARRHLRRDDQLALEATFHTWALVDLFAPWVGRIVVSNPLRTKAIALAKVKTDTIDAKVLADLLRCGYLPEVWQPDAETRRWRALTHRRSALVADRTAVKNRLHSTLDQRLIAAPVADLFSERGLTWLREIALDDDGRFILDSDLRLLAHIEAEIQDLDTRLAPLAYGQKQVRLLMTLPGVDMVVALGLLAAWGDAKRFPDADRAASALGLVPSTRQSGDHCYHGRITKQGNSHARWLLIQAAQHVDKHPGPLGAFFRRLAQKKNRNVAVVATARKLATVAWHMLHNEEPYRYAQPKTVEAKLARLRVRATKTRRRSGAPKGAPRSENYGTGTAFRTTPSLAEALQKEDLPRPRAIAELPAGEIKALQQANTIDYAKSLERPYKRPKSKQVPTTQLTPS